MTKFRLAIVNNSDTGVCLDQFCQIAHVPYETKRKLFGGPDAPVPLYLKLLVELV